MTRLIPDQDAVKSLFTGLALTRHLDGGNYAGLAGGQTKVVSSIASS